MQEFEVINEYFLGAMMPDHVSAGPGDDCAVMSVPAGHELCVSTDTLLESVHFPSGASPDLIARRAIAANLSDLAAMGAAPHSMTMALTLPGLEPAWLRGFSAESQRLAEIYECPIVGGNLAEGALSVTLTVIGIVPTGQALMRSGAQSDDNLYVSGCLGGAAGAVAQLTTVNPSARLLEYYEQPNPRLALGQSLRSVASSAIDLSDGLLADLTHLLNASKMGARLDVSQLPIPDILVKEFSRGEAEAFALSGGDDYELCFTASSTQHDQIVSIGRNHSVEITCLGSVNNESGVIRDSNEEILPAEGYQHFVAAGQKS